MNRFDLSETIQRIEFRLRRLDQNRRNARMIGEFAVSQFEKRIIRRPARVEVDTAIDEVSLTAERRAREVAPTVNRWLLLSAAELIEKIEEMSIDELRLMFEAESNGRRRISVIEAVERRLAE
jgi:hypothetical protein